MSSAVRGGWSHQFECQTKKQKVLLPSGNIYVVPFFMVSNHCAQVMKREKSLSYSWIVEIDLKPNVLNSEGWLISHQFECQTNKDKVLIPSGNIYVVPLFMVSNHCAQVMKREK